MIKILPINHSLFSFKLLKTKTIIFFTTRQFRHVKIDENLFYKSFDCYFLENIRENNKIRNQPEQVHI